MTRYRFDLLDIKEILVSEGVEHWRVEKIKASIINTNLLLKPIIVEMRRKFVIDGHHRLKALALLGASKAPVILADYDSDIDDVGRWIYVADPGCLRCDEFVRLVNELGSLVKRGSDVSRVGVGGEAFSLNVDRLDFYIALKYIDAPLSKVPQGLFKESAYRCYLIPPKLTPNDLYILLSRGLTLPPRSTLHRTYLKEAVIPYPIKRLVKR